MPASEEDTWSGATPASIIEKLSSRVDADERTVQNIISPHPGTPVSYAEEVLAEGRIPLKTSDGSMVSSELVDDHFCWILGFLRAANNFSLLSANLKIIILCR